MSSPPATLAFFANTSWYLVNFRLGLLRDARARGCRVLALAPPDDDSPALAEHGIEYRPLRFRRRDFTPWGKERSVREVRWILCEEKVDLLHSFTLESILTAHWAARRRSPRPALVHSVTGMGFVFAGGGASRRLLRAGLTPLLRRAFRKAPVIVENRADAARIEAMRGGEHRYPLVSLPGGGVDLAQFSPEGDALLPRQGRSVRFLLAGRLLRDKGAALFVEAARRVVDPNAEFLLAGEPDEGNPDSLSRAEVEGWMDPPRLRWLGRVRDMPGLLRSVDVLVHPTLYGEGLPRILMEAAACGRPAITTDIPACLEAVAEGETAWILRDKNPRALARLLQEAIDEPEERRRRGQKAIAWARDRFSEEEMNRQTFAVYRQAYPHLAARLPA
mgnify:CR=1 FL=1